MTFWATWIGDEGAAWERLCLVFDRMGYYPPRPFDESMDSGNYAAWIADEYGRHFTQEEVYNVILFARKSLREIHGCLDGLSEKEAERYVITYPFPADE
jgi:hypothetical protein